MFKVNTKALERRSTVFNVDVEYISHFLLLFLMLNLNKQMFAGSRPIIL